MTAKYTPGPWGFEYDASVVLGGVVIGQVAPDEASFEERMANARLIAAAPELLALLQDFADPMFYSDPNTMAKIAQAVIAKATGEQL